LKRRRWDADHLKSELYVDRVSPITIIMLMKLSVVIVLLAIALGVLAPPSLPLMIIHDGQSSIGVLDVCHSAVPALSSSGEMPCVSECLGSLPLLVPTEIYGIVNPPCKAVFISYQKELPPKV
jgi:hypothetical protein